MKKIAAVLLIAAGIYVAAFYTVKIEIAPSQAIACENGDSCN